MKTDKAKTFSQKTKTQNLKESFLFAFESSACNVAKACKKSHIDRSTFYRWQKEDEVFALRVEEMQQGLLDLAEESLIKKIKKGDTVATIFFLKTKGKQRGYTEKKDVNLSSDKGIQIEIIDSASQVKNFNFND